MDGHIILRFGTRRVLLSSHDGQPATMTKPADGDYVTFDFSPCEVLGSVTVEDGQPEPTPGDILAASYRFQSECNQKIRDALAPAAIPRRGLTFRNKRPARVFQHSSEPLAVRGES